MGWLLQHVPRSLLTVPVPVSDQPDDVMKLAKAGFATVVRIALTSPAAMADVEAQIAEFTDGETPPTLFLDRIGSLSVEVHGPSHRTTRIVRRSTPLFEVDGPVPFSVAKNTHRWNRLPHRQTASSARRFRRGRPQEHRTRSEAGGMARCSSGYDCLARRPARSCRRPTGRTYCYYRWEKRFPRHSWAHACTFPGIPEP